jgi:hypothetical protein
MRALAIAATLAALAAPLAPASAASVFNENFDAIAGGFYDFGSHPGKFAVTSGNVDIFGSAPSPYPCGAVGNGCLDLNGIVAGGVTSNPIAVIAGRTYTISFDLAGNATPQLPSDTSPYTLDVSFGGATHSFAAAPLEAFRTITFDVVAGVSGNTALGFLSTSPNVPTYWGAVLDNVSVTTPDSTGAVPEPASWAMMLIGFGLAGYGLRRTAKPWVQPL